MSTASASEVTSAVINKHAYGDPVQTHLFAAFAAIAWYNAIELVVLCFVSFKRRRGCYFWSLLLSSTSIIPHCIGYVLLFFTDTNRYVCVSLIAFSWYFMVTGQSVVLWSRLHLVLQNTKVLWGILCMIIVDFFLFQVPNTVFLFGTVSVSGPSTYSAGYNIFERIQLVAYLLQEVIISTTYVVETVRLLRLRPQGRPSGILRQLLTINILILLLDIAVVAIEFVGFYSVQVMFKPVAYSVKLKLEYAILGKLVALARGPSISGYDYELPSSTRDIDSLPSSQEPSHLVEVQRDAHRKYSIPWFWDTSRQPSRT
ncbi:hypothetical protein N7492_001921 [Penicillium capsulatum]|uniref:DUF7703 domain-containing protein n=1 Tax=Penicillium capsulatum TaxID=69766 RepID=A0A9W9IN34_9EURO|nr:hypothetical protein N7492_001921 [Penicillium capsulatum]KAJ6123456.1 hypothetical protein N7512_005921 [Penicillium capsulatum]